MDLSISKKLSTMERDYIMDLLSRGTRIDGRGFLEYREITIDAGPMLKAEGSARVNLGDTQIYVGVKYELGTPYPDAPDTGIITCMAELVPFASQMFESGPPREDAIELARVVDRGIRHSEIVDKKKLCVTPGEEVILLFTDIYYTAHNGNPWDCASLAAICALKSVMLPHLEKVEQNGQMFWAPSGTEWSLDIQDYPVTITFAKIGNYIIVDPNLLEELICDARISYCIDKEGRITSIQKNGSGTFSKEELVETAKNARDLAPVLQEKVKNYERDLSNM
ncbi:MAG: exosome complex protein Rrp42 [Candidatus Hodarchaeota archaeon]